MLKKILLNTLGVSVLGVSVLLILIFNPSLLYAHKSTVLNHTVYHDKPLGECFEERLLESLSLIQASELYDSQLDFKICLDQKSVLPQIMNTLQGPAYGWGFFNQIVLRGDINCTENTIAIHGHKWNFSQLMAHELTHCLQIHTFGFLNSNPVANHETWKWEGYPEYISRKNLDQIDLKANIDLKQEYEQANGKTWAVKFNNNTVSPTEYYNYWLYVMYCMEIKGMSYKELIENKTIKNEILESELLEWYNNQKQNR